MHPVLYTVSAQQKLLGALWHSDYFETVPSAITDLSSRSCGFPREEQKDGASMQEEAARGFAWI